MSLSSSDIKLNQDVDPTVRRFQAAITRDLEQLYLLMGQGLGGFSNQSPGAISQDVNTNGMGVEANQGDYTFSGPVSRAQLENGLNNIVIPSTDLTPFARMYTYGSPTVYSGSGTHTFTANKLWAIFEIIAGGGSGAGGSASGGSNSIAGGGGGEGERTYVVTPITATTAAVVVGAGGAAVAAAANGNNGAISSITMSTVLWNAQPGSQGLAAGYGGLGGDTGTIKVGIGFSFRVHGRDGAPGTLSTVTYSGAGAVTSLSHLGGLGAGVGPGGGGLGGQPTQGSVAGIDGQVSIWEA